MTRDNQALLVAAQLEERVQRIDDPIWRWIVFIPAYYKGSYAYPFVWAQSDEAAVQYLRAYP